MQFIIYELYNVMYIFNLIIGNEFFPQSNANRTLQLPEFPDETLIIHYFRIRFA